MSVLALAADQLIVPLAAALIVAVGGLAVGWRQLTLLGNAPRAELEARTVDIIQKAEDRATSRALEALKLALDVTERERDRALAEVASCREVMDKMRERLAVLEEIVERRIKSVETTSERRESASAERIDTLRDEVTKLGGDVDEINNRGKPGPQGPPGDKGEPGDPGPAVL